MDIDSPTPAIGIDLLRPDIDTNPGRAIMQFQKTQAYMQDDQVVIMTLEEAPKLYLRTPSGITLAPKEDPDLVRRALGIATWTTHAYQRRLYGLPEDDQSSRI